MADLPYAFIYVNHHDGWKRWSGPWATRDVAQHVLDNSIKPHWPHRQFVIVGSQEHEANSWDTDHISVRMEPKTSELPQ